MGAIEFNTGVIPSADAAEAYDAAVRDARHQYGSDGYNGTVSTTAGYRKMLHSPITARGAELYAQRHCENASKWGDALAVPVAGDEHFHVRTEKFTVEMEPVDSEGNPRIIREYDLHEKALELAAARFGDRLHDINVAAKIKSRTTATHETGRAVTRYELVGSHAYRPKLFDTRAQAVAAAKLLLNESRGIEKIRIRGVKFYPETNSTDATVVAVETVRATATVTATIAVPKQPYGTPVDGWVFFGLAAC